MFVIDLLPQFEEDYVFAEILISEYFSSINESDKILEKLRELDGLFDELMDQLSINPYFHQVYEFNPALPTAHDYRSARLMWFTVFWWVDEVSATCHLYRFLPSKGDFAKSGSW
jgi:hypothetical protein